MKKSKILMFVLPLTLVSCSPNKVTFALPKFEEPVETHSDIQLERFINNPDVLTDISLHYLDGLYYRNDYSKPNPVVINFTATPDKGSVKNYSIKIADNEKLENPFIDVCSAYSYSFYNAELGKTYFYQISADSFISDVASFSTKEGNLRLIDIDGVSNVRDIAIKGKIKQGLIYRGGALEKLEDKTVNTKISLLGINEMKSLNIKTEVDLRKNIAESGSSIAENCNLTTSKVDGVNYINYPLYYGGYDILTYNEGNYNNPSQIKKFFDLISDKSNLPIYMHCSEGKDRTGCLSYLLQALLGADEEDMLRDYVFSNFANTSYSMKPNGVTGKYGATLRNYQIQHGIEGTFADVVYDYLNKVVGISAVNLTKVIENLKE